MAKRVRCIRLDDETYRLLRSIWLDLKKNGIEVSQGDVVRLALLTFKNEKIDIVKLEYKSR